MIPGIPLTNNSSTTTQLLTLTLGGAATTTYPTASVYSYIIPPQAKTVTSAQGYIAADASEYRRAPEFTLLTAATKTTIAAAAPSGSVKMVTGVSIHNPDTVSMTMTVAIDDNGTTRVQAKWTLLTLETLYYGNGEWYCVDANGNRKEATSSNFSSLTVTGLVDISASGAGQIKFPATQNASSDANTLDDYEEGTWTPTDQSGATLTFTNPAGTYTKIGRDFRASCYLQYPVTASGSNSLIGGLPFTVANANEARQGFVSNTSEATLIHATPTANSTNFAPLTAAGAAITNATLSSDEIYATIYTHV